MWRQICHLEKFLHIRNVETICFVLIYAILSQNQFVLPFTLFCCEINFVTIYAFLRGEKFRQQLCLWRKKDIYQVCALSVWPTINQWCLLNLMMFSKPYFLFVFLFSSWYQSDPLSISGLSDLLMVFQFLIVSYGFVLSVLAMISVWPTINQWSHGFADFSVFCICSS